MSDDRRELTGIRFRALAAAAAAARQGINFRRRDGIYVRRDKTHTPAANVNPTHNPRFRRGSPPGTNKLED